MLGLSVVFFKAIDLAFVFVKIDLMEKEGKGAQL